MAVKVVVVLAVFCAVLFIIKNTLWFHIRNLLINRELQPPSFSEHIKHYVMIIKKSPKPTELIREIRNEELRVPINDGTELLYTITIDKDESDKFYLTLRTEGSNTPIYLHLYSAYDLPDVDEQIRLIYTNTKTYGKN